MAIQTDDRVVIETPAGRRRRNLIFAVIVTGVLAVVAADRSDGTFGLVIGLAGLVFFGPLTLAMLLRAMRNRPALILDADGFTDYGSMISAGYVPWQEVQRIEERAFRRRVFVAIKVIDPAAFRARQSAWHRFLLRVNGPMAAGDILIPDNVLPMSPAALVKTMRQMHRAAQRRAHSGGTGKRA
jgi:hypothetical protein